MTATGIYITKTTDVIHSVDLDIMNRDNIPEPIHLTQYDAKYQLVEVKLWNGEEEYVAPENTVVSVRYLKPDHTYVYNQALGYGAIVTGGTSGTTTKTNRNIVYIEITQQMTAAAGKGRFIVEITNLEGDKVLGTASVDVLIDANPVQEDGVESSSEFKTLTQYVGEAESAKNEAVTSARNAKISETNAANSEASALASKNAAATSAGNAKISEDNALASKNAAATSAGNAKTSETNAKTSETNAANSEASALASKNAAKTSEDNALASERKAKTSENNAKTSETNAANSATSAGTSATNAAKSAQNAKTSESNAKESETNAENAESRALVSAQNAKISETNAGASAADALMHKNAAATSATQAHTSEVNAASSATAAQNAKTSVDETVEALETYVDTTKEEMDGLVDQVKAAKTSAETAATNAANSATSASGFADDAAKSASDAEASAANNEHYAKLSESYAVGTSGQRPNEAIDNAKYYYEQSKGISEGLKGALMPMGTVAFANLPPVSEAQPGWSYNISDKFTTTVDFKEGPGHTIPAGSNIYKTADGFWDVLAGTPVTTVNGETGDVVVDLENIEGILPISKGGTGSDTEIYLRNTGGIVTGNLEVTGLITAHTTQRFNNASGISFYDPQNINRMWAGYDASNEKRGLWDSILNDYFCWFDGSSANIKIDAPKVGGTGKYIKSVSQENGKLIAEADNLTAANVGAFGKATLLQTENLNNYGGYQHEGFYYAMGGNTVLNKPSGVGVFGMFVMRTGDGVVWEILVESEGNKGIYRRFWNGSSWTSWETLPLGIKGNRETIYRGGLVNLTPENIGAVPYCNGIVTGSTNWNDVINPGSFKVQDATMDAAHNAPIGMYRFGTLILFWSENNGSGESRKVQMYIPHNYGGSHIMAIRTFNSTAWGPWYYINDATINDATYVKKTGDTMTGRLSVKGNNSGVHVINGDESKALGLAFDSAGVIRGLYDKTLGRFVAYLDSVNQFVIDSTLNVVGRSWFRRSIGQGNYTGTVGTAGWVVIAQIKIKGSYVNYTLEFEVGGRGRTLSTILSIMFKNVDNVDPDLEGFYYYGGVGSIFRLKKTASSTWQLVAQKNETYGRIDIIRVHSCVEMTSNNIEITYPGTQLTTDPDSTWKAPAISGEVSYANSAGTLSTVLPIPKGGTGAATANAAFDNLATSVGNESDDYGFRDVDELLWIFTRANNTMTARKTQLSKLWNYIKSKLATVATTGSYNNLTDTPTIPAPAINTPNNPSSSACFPVPPGQPPPPCSPYCRGLS